MRVPRPTALEALAALLATGLALSYAAPERFRSAANRLTTARADIFAIESALEAYEYDTGGYPGTARGLRALVDSSRRPSPYWDGPYLLRFTPDDPWGHPYVYQASAAPERRGYVLLSYGADGRPGGSGADADVSDVR